MKQDHVILSENMILSFNKFIEIIIRVILRFLIQDKFGCSQDNLTNVRLINFGCFVEQQVIDLFVGHFEMGSSDESTNFTFK